MNNESNGVLVIQKFLPLLPDAYLKGREDMFRTLCQAFQEDANIQMNLHKPPKKFFYRKAWYQKTILNIAPWKWPTTSRIPNQHPLLFSSLFFRISGLHG
jgi:hypothetical protein